MSVTIGGVTVRHLLEQPFGYQTGDVYRGRSARAWDVNALVSEAQWTAILGVYEALQVLKAAEGDPVDTGVVGATVLFSGTGYGQTWANVPVWFLDAPAASQRGRLLSCSFTVVDAAEYLAMLLAEAADDEEGGSGATTYGTLVVGGVTITLLADPEEYEGGPEVAMAASGTDVITGPLAARRVRNVNGYVTDEADLATLRSWYESTIATKPSAGDWYPISPPQRTDKKVVGLETRHYVELSLRLIV